MSRQSALTEVGGARRPGTKVASVRPNAGEAMRLARRLWQDHVRQHRARLLATLAIIAVVALATSTYPILIARAFDAFADQSPWAMTTLPWLVLAAAFARGAALYGQVLLTQRTVTQVEMDMQARLYRALVGADLAQIAEQPAAAWTQRFTTDLYYVRHAIVRVIAVLIRDGLTVLALFATMIYLDMVLALIVVAILPVALLPVVRIGHRLRRVARRTQERTGDMAGLATETFGAARVVKTYALENYLMERARAVFEALRSLRLKAAVHKGRVDPIMEVLGGAAICVILLVIGWRILSGGATIGEFSGFLGALLIASPPMRALGNLNATVQEGLAALARYYAVIDREPRVADRPGAVPATFGADAVRFEDVHFSYDGTVPALFGVSFEAAARRTTALVGRSGAGKSTVFNLVPRLYDPSAGRVLMAGTDVRAMTLDSLRARVAVVSQDVTLFDDTVGANIALGRPGASAADVEAAARLAGAHGFIARLEAGYDAPAGERGQNFSGGERQRIALGRAFLKDAPILLLDEATSALDAETEAVVREALDRLSHGRTTLVIAHRLATVRAADTILVLDEGRVVEQGPHDALVAADGLYARFHRLQLAED